MPRGSSYFLGQVVHRDALFHPPITFLIRSPMTEYFDYHGINSGHLDAGPPSSFVRPLNLSDRKSGHTSQTSRASGASGLTYATNGSAPVRDETQQSPAEPIMGMPTPVMPPKGLHLSGEEQYDDEDDEDPEYMMVDADLSMVSQFGSQNQPPSVMQEPPPKVHHNKPVPVKVQGGRKGFVGGFVSGLRRLPRMMLRNQRGQTVQRQPSHDTVLELPGFGEDSPGYDPFRASVPHHPPPLPRHPPPTPASHPVTSMHYSHYTHEERSESPTSRDPRDFDDEELDHNHSGSEEDEDDDRRSIHKPPTIAHSTHQSTHYSHHSTHHSNRPSAHQSNHNSSSHSNHHSTHQPTHPSTRHSTPHRSTPPSRQTALDGDTTLNHQTQNGEPGVVVNSLLPTSDYKSMLPESSSSSSSSITANANRIQKFVTDVYNLPWVATKVAVDFVPERDGRMYHGMDPNAKRLPKPLQSWYPPIHKDLDLLADPPPQSAPVMAHRRQDGHRRALTESSPTSGGITQSAITTPSTIYSASHHRYSVTSEPIPRHARHTRDFRHSHRHHHRRRHRDHSRPHSPPIYPVLANPQPLYLYSGHGSPPVMPIPQPALGSSPSSPRSKRGVASPAVPALYMIPVPPPVYQPMSGFSYATPQPTQSQPATNPPTTG